MSCAVGEPLGTPSGPSGCLGSFLAAGRGGGTTPRLRVEVDVLVGLLCGMEFGPAPSAYTQSRLEIEQGPHTGTGMDGSPRGAYQLPLDLWNRKGCEASKRIWSYN